MALDFAVTDQDLEALLAWTPAELPRNFVNLLRRSDGARQPGAPGSVQMAEAHARNGAL